MTTQKRQNFPQNMLFLRHHQGQFQKFRWTNGASPKLFPPWLPIARPHGHFRQQEEWYVGAAPLHSAPLRSAPLRSDTTTQNTGTTHQYYMHLSTLQDEAHKTRYSPFPACHFAFSKLVFFSLAAPPAQQAGRGIRFFFNLRPNREAGGKREEEYAFLLPTFLNLKLHIAKVNMLTGPVNICNSYIDICNTLTYSQSSLGVHVDSQSIWTPNEC